MPFTANDLRAGGKLLKAMKTAKVFPLEIFTLYGILSQVVILKVLAQDKRK